MGDEPCAQNIPGDIIKRLTSTKQASTLSTAEILAEAQKYYQVYHLHLHHDAYSQTEVRKQGWKDLLGDNFIVLEDYQQVPKTMAAIVISAMNKQQTTDAEPNDVYVEEML